MGVAVIGKKIFVIGGFNPTDRYLSTVEVLDTETNKWSTLPSMKTARRLMGITVIDDRFIWIFGGSNGDRFFDSIEIFDVEKNEWVVAPTKLRYPKHIKKAITVDHKIFIIGGRDSSWKNLELVEVLDIDEMKWPEVSEINRIRCLHSMIGFYVIKE